jgi:hypothetical protein
VLDSNGYYPCTANAVDGITLHNFLPGSYSFTIEGYDADNAILFAKSGNFTVNGNITVRTDLAATGAAPPRPSSPGGSPTTSPVRRLACRAWT